MQLLRAIESLFKSNNSNNNNNTNDENNNYNNNNISFCTNMIAANKGIFPDDTTIITLIFSFLTPHELAQVSMTCKLLFSYSLNQDLWRPFCLQRYFLQSYHKKVFLLQNYSKIIRESIF